MKRRTSAVATVLLSAVMLTLVFVPGGVRPTVAGSSAVTPTASTRSLSPTPTFAVPKSAPQAAPILTNQLATSSPAVSMASLNRAFVSIQSPDSVAVLDTTANETVQPGVTWPKPPGDGEMTPDGTHVFFVGHQGENEGDGTVYGMNTSTHRIDVTIPLAGCDQRGIAITPDGQRMYVADNCLQTVTPINLQTNTAEIPIELSAHPEQIALSPDGSRLYLAANSPDAIFVIDTSTNQIIKTFQAGANSHGVAVSPDGQLIYIGNGGEDEGGGSVSVFAATDFSPVTTFPAGIFVSALTLTPDGRTLYATNFGGNDVVVIDTQTATMKTITLTSLSYGPAAISEDGTNVYVALTDGKVAVINPVTNVPPQYISVGGLAVAVITKTISGNRPVPPKKVVVFLQGACTSINDGTGNGGDTFNNLQDLLRKQYGYNDADLLMYSYKGGFVDNNGIWHHNAYSRNDPIQQDFQTNSLAALHDQLLIPYHAKHPDTTFILVGHSLGGVVAFEEIVQKINSPDYQRGLISKVITVDAPLHGITPTTFLAGVFPRSLDCLSQGVATGILVGRYNNEPATSNTLKQMARTAKQKGVALVTAGNTYDCVWEPARCGWPLDIGYSDTQLILDPDVLTSAFSIPQPCLKLKRECFIGTHNAVLDKKIGSSALQAIATYIGKQTYSISGQVTDANDNPLAGVTISIDTGTSAITDDNGNYTLPGLPAGTYTLTPSDKGYTFRPTTRTIHLLKLRRDATTQNFKGKMSLLAPFNNGVTWTTYNGYYDNESQDEGGCGIGSNPLDHCRNQLFALDLVPDQTNPQDMRQILAPINGKVVFIGNLPGGCVLLTLDDKLNLNVCHFQSVNVQQGQRVERGKVLGTRSSTHVHLSLDNRNNMGSLCLSNPNTSQKCYLPVPFNGIHALEGQSLDPSRSWNNGTVVDLGLVYPLCAVKQNVNCQFKVKFQEWRDVFQGSSSNIAIP
jgi:YVTN family beta-propeller protein